MAARDDTYRNQRTLDIVFALSCIAMLAALVWMFWKDHYREYKDVQRRGREVEVAVLSREADRAVEGKQAEIASAKNRLSELLNEYGLTEPKDNYDYLKNVKDQLPAASNSRIRNELEPELDRKKAEQVRLQTELAAEKANRDALISERDILVQKNALAAAVERKEREVRAKVDEIGELERRVEQIDQEVARLQQEVEQERRPLTQAINELDRLTREQDRLLRTADQRRMGAGATFRAWPIIDAFASPYRIQQHTPEGLLLDYNFKQVQRVDRCATCHQFIDRGGFDKDGLRDLKDLQLSPSEVAAYATHPRLDLFVGSNSPHSIEKFGCTICHGGQGGAATFNFAYHFPDKGKTNGDQAETYGDKRRRWEHDHHWHADLHPDYLWDFPMLPGRFIESTCLKCHHQVTDLIRNDGKEEAPKALKGYRLVKDLGCFGCHEIGGYKSGRAIGPDLRLEPHPPLDELTPAERAKMAFDPNDPPGDQRKVGPGLRRIAEKTHEEWTAKWIRSPRAFRPETKMPHFFGVTNNTPGKLADHQEGPSQLPAEQQAFPDAEIRAITFYLFKESQAQIERMKAAQQALPSEWDEEQAARQAFQNIEELRKQNPARVPRDADPSLPVETPVSKLAAASAEQREKLTKDQLIAVLAYFGERDRQRRTASPLGDRPYPPPELKDFKADAKLGEQLFKSRGCLACHSHEGAKYYGQDGTLLSQQDYGPSLRGLRDKLGDPAKAQKWLYYWIMDPTTYHTRTFMPNTQLEPQQAANIAAWLLDAGHVPPGEDFLSVEVKPLETETLQRLARVYLDKQLLKSQAAEAAEKGLTQAGVKHLRPDADERILVAEPPAGSPLAMLKDHTERLTYYVGRKSISRYGCYACHDIPGFETAKPIGTPLNDWGRKDAERLAFENIISYVKNHHRVPGHSHESHASSHAGAGHEYESFFFDRLESHHREGFLFQKLKEPRSYDYDKLRTWDERLRMPQFKFSNPRPKQGESDEDFARRAAQEEDEAVEAVMTFVLGLVADPVPMKFVNQPRQDRLNEVKGLQLLEKYNCVGCHITKPGGYEFSPNAVVNDQPIREQLLATLSGKAEDLRRDPAFPEHSAWKAQKPYPPGQVVAHGLPRGVDPDAGVLYVELWEALRFTDDQGIIRDFPAGLNPIPVPMKASKQHPPTGGVFASILPQVIDPQGTGNPGLIRGSVPPVLHREGQKAQAQWLLEFLRHPHEIRPAVGAHLKMPRFNMSDDEARALVDYFIAADRLENPALGLEYLARRPPQRDAEFQRQKRQEFTARLKQMNPKSAEGADYFEAGFRMLADNNLCKKCHNLGSLQAEGKPEEKGPNLDQTGERLRPDYIERYVSLPARFLPYTLMPQYDPFYADPHYALQKSQLQKPAVKGLMQAGVLLSPHAGLPALPVDDALYNRIMTEFALSPREKVRMVRDALMSWGHLSDPPPTAKRAGKPADVHGDHK